MLSIIIPAYNERATLPRALARVSAALPEVEKEVVIVDDCSTDGTREWLREHFPAEPARVAVSLDEAGEASVTPAAAGGAGFSVRIVYHTQNAGKGAALRSGLAAAGGDVFVFQDADLEYEPADWAVMYDLIAVRQVADVVYGSRFHGNAHRSLNFHHYIGNRLISTLFNAIYNQTLTDVEVCYKMFSRAVKETIDITCDDFGCEIQFSAQVAIPKRWRIYEVGISYFGRTHAEGKKINWRDGVKALWYLLKFRFASHARVTSAPRDRTRKIPVMRPGIATRVTLALFAALLAVYTLSPVVTPFDSRWSIQTAMSLVRGHGGALSEYMPALKKNDFYAIEYPNGQPRSRYPIGVSVLAAPIVAVAAWIDPRLNDELKEDVLGKFEKFVASIFGALAGVFFFWLILSRFASIPIAAAATVIFAFATPMWSTATRALWQHGPLVLMLVIAMLILERARKKPQLIQFVSLPLAMAYLIRPTAAVPVMLISAYVLLFYRDKFERYIGWALLIAVPWIIYNLRVYHLVLPWYYYHEAFSATTDFAVGLPGNLFSPSRGLFVYSPVLLFAFSGFVIAWHDRERRALHIVYALITLGITIIVGAGSMWWGGHGFGPRFMTDTVPFFAYFTAYNFKLATGQAWRQYALSGAVAVFALLAIAINSQGALRQNTLDWNVKPLNIDQNPMRAWDWRDPQFAYGLNGVR